MPTLAELYAKKFGPPASAPGAPTPPASGGTPATGSGGAAIPEAESTLKYVLRQIGKPGAATAGLVGGFLAKDLDEGLARAGANLSGERRDDFSDVLGEQGMAPGIGRTALGFAGDMILDPTNLVPVAKGAKLVGAGVRGLGAAYDATKAVPGVGHALRGLEQAGGAVRNAVGEVFDPYHSLKANPDYQQARRLLDSERHAVADNAWHEVLGRYAGTTADERIAVQAALDAGKLPPSIAPDSKLAKLWQAQREKYAEVFDEGVSAGTLRPEQRIENYAPRVMTGKALDEAKTFRDINARDKFAKARTKDAPSHLTERDAAQAAFARESAGARSALAGRHLQRVGREFGEQLDADLVKAAEAGDREAVESLQQAEALFREQGMVPLREIVGEAPLREQLAGTWVPSAIARDLETFNEAPGDVTMLGGLIDKATRAWRTQATVLRPGFHATNLAGNLYNALLGGQQGGSLARTYLAANPWGKLPAVGNLPGDAIESYLHKHGLSHVGSAFGDELSREGLEGSLNRALGGKALDTTDAVMRSGNAVVRGMSKLGAAIENTSKRAFFLNQLEQQAKANGGSLRPKDLDNAMIAVKDALFDYRELSKTDRQIRRAVPFWTWTRKNVPLQVKGTVKNPHVPAALSKTQHAIEEATKEAGVQTPEAERPDYMQQDGLVQLPMQLQDGARVFANPYLPPLDLNKIPIPGGSSGSEVLAELASALTPLVKVPLEIGANKSFFTGRPLYDEQLGVTQDMRPSPAALQVVPRALAQHIPGVKEDPKTGRYFSPALPNILFENAFPFASAGGKVMQAGVDPEAASNRLNVAGFLGWPKLTARTKEQTMRDAKQARTDAKRERAAKNKQKKLSPLEAAILKAQQQP